MTRVELKKYFGHYRPSLIRPEMLETVSERKLAQSRENINLRYERSMKALYADKSLTDEQRWVEYSKISSLAAEAREKLAPLERRCNLIGERRMVAIINWTKSNPVGSRRRAVV